MRSLISVHLCLSVVSFLERKERFELSNRVWKTRMFPATSLPQVAQAFQLALFHDADPSDQRHWLWGENVYNCGTPGRT